MSYPRAKIPISDVIRCIRSGMDDRALSRRFGLPAASLKLLCEKLSAAEGPSYLVSGDVVECTPDGRPIIRIGIPDVLAFIRAGADDEAIKARYGLTARGLRSLFRKLVATGAISQEELDGRIVALAASRATPVPVGVGGNLNSFVVSPSAEAPVQEEEPPDDFSCPGPGDRTTELLDESSIPQRVESARSAAESKFTVYYVRHRESNRVLFCGEALSWRALVESALATGVDLSEANLEGISLAGADLSRAKLARANLTRANLVGADLTRAMLAGATLESAELFGAIVSEANLMKANLSDSNLTMVYGVRAYLLQANLSEANLTNANLEEANLIRAVLFQTIFKGTNLRGAQLQGANLEIAKVVNILR